MTRQNAGMVIGDWQWAFLHLKYNAAVETSTGFIVRKYMEIDCRSMMVFVKTIDSGIVVDVGLLSTETGGDADGFIDGLSVATAGWIRPATTLTQGTNAHYATTTFGVLFLPAACLGANVAEQNAVLDYKHHMGDGVAKTITYTPTSSDTFEGWLAFRHRQHPDPSLDNFQWPVS
jgi:hypothetical protein